MYTPPHWKEVNGENDTEEGRGKSGGGGYLEGTEIDTQGSDRGETGAGGDDGAGAGN